MSKLEIYSWNGLKREVQFVGYGRDHLTCFIRDERKVPAAIGFKLPSRFDLRFREKTIGETGTPPTTFVLLRFTLLLGHPRPAIAGVTA